MKFRQPTVFVSASQDLRSTVNEILQDIPAGCQVYVGDQRDAGKADFEGPRPVIAGFYEHLKDAHLYLAAISEHANSIHPYSAGEQSQLAQEVRLARQNDVDIRMFRKSHFVRSRVNKVHSDFIETAEQNGEVELYSSSDDLAVKVSCALRLWLTDYWCLILADRRNRLWQVGATWLICLVVVALTLVGSLVGWITLINASLVILVSTVFAMTALTIPE